jgi:hypothetical protein
MKWTKKNQTATEGVLHVASVVNDHGSVFRPVHQETDLGVDGHIELTQGEIATGKLVAVQVKSGDSYLADNGREFYVPIDEKHMNYWLSYPLPVILVCYSPTKKTAAWISVKIYAESEQYFERMPIKSIRILCSSNFDIHALNKEIASLADEYTDRRILIECVDKCLTGDSKQRFQGLSILSAHPDSRDSRTIAFLSRQLLFDDDKSVADQAIYTLAYHVGRFRWSWNPNNSTEQQLMEYASSLCRDFTSLECRRLVERVDDESFGGPDALGERVYDLLACCSEAQDVVHEIAVDRAQPLARRIKALYMLYGCDDGELLDHRELADDLQVGDVYRAMYSEELELPDSDG